MYHATGLDKAEILDLCEMIHRHTTVDERTWPGFFIGVAVAGLNYSLVISIMVFLAVGRVVVRLSRRCAGFHAPVGVLS